MKVAIIEFPGSSGVDDAKFAFELHLGCEVSVIWHQQEFIKDADILVIPGGSSFGDYLRPGALAKVSPVISAIRKYANEGRPVIGIGNGFQILCEIEVLPGVLLPNLSSDFLNIDAFMIPDDRTSIWTKHLEEEQILRLPLSCYFGRYFLDARSLRDMEENGRVAYRYSDFEAEVHLDRPFNGSVGCIAGVLSRNKNVLGIMAHPERAFLAEGDSSVQGQSYGETFFSGILKNLKGT